MRQSKLAFAEPECTDILLRIWHFIYVTCTKIINGTAHSYWSRHYIKGWAAHTEKGNWRHLDIILWQCSKHLMSCTSIPLALTPNFTSSHHWYPPLPNHIPSLQSPDTPPSLSLAPISITCYMTAELTRSLNIICYAAATKNLIVPISVLMTIKHSWLWALGTSM